MKNRIPMCLGQVYFPAADSFWRSSFAFSHLFPCHIDPGHQLASLIRVESDGAIEMVQSFQLLVQVLGVDLAEVGMDSRLIVAKLYRALPELDGQTGVVAAKSHKGQSIKSSWVGTYLRRLLVGGPS